MEETATLKIRGFLQKKQTMWLYKLTLYWMPRFSNYAFTSSGIQHTSTQIKLLLTQTTKKGEKY